MLERCRLADLEDALRHGGRWVPITDLIHEAPPNYELSKAWPAGNAQRTLNAQAKQGQRDTLYLPSALWKWEPPNRDPSKCSLRRVTLQSWCSALLAHNLSRIMFVGESLQHQMYQSLVNLLGIDINSTLDSHLARTLIGACHDGRHFQMRWIRNDFLEDDLTKSHCSLDGIQNCTRCTEHRQPPVIGKDFCLPFLHEYVDSHQQTLLVLNTGPHFHDTISFRHDFDRFLDRLDQVARQIPKNRHDMVVFRTSVPGHEDCHRFTRPLDTPPPNISRQYTWDLIPAFNEIARGMLSHRRHTPVDLLDVAPMTLLRPDGHLDCLHYALPGPIDWWNAALLAQLHSSRA